MSCPNCSHTMAKLTDGFFHCPRCGTVLNNKEHAEVYVPMLVSRCKAFHGYLNGIYMQKWKSLGISDCLDTTDVKEWTPS